MNGEIKRVIDPWRSCSLMIKCMHCSIKVCSVGGFLFKGGKANPWWEEDEDEECHTIFPLFPFIRSPLLWRMFEGRETSTFGPKFPCRHCFLFLLGTPHRLLWMGRSAVQLLHREGGSTPTVGFNPTTIY